MACGNDTTEFLLCGQPARSARNRDGFAGGRNKVLALTSRHNSISRHCNGSVLMANSLSSSPKSTNRFSSELVWTMRSVLEAAVEQIDIANRTPATKAKMAERILRDASHGVTDPEQLKAIAIEDGKQPAD